MRKYRIEHFHIELVEETNSPEEREIYWIEKLNAYKNGYNATKGGEGKQLYDHDAIVSALKNAPYSDEITEKFGCSIDIVHQIAR